VTGGQNAQTRADPKQRVDKPGTGVQKVLAIVEDKQALARLQVVD
jgi:hypothetical protein